MVSPSLAVTWVPPARDQPAGSPSAASGAFVVSTDAGFTVPVTVVSTLTRGLESAGAEVVPATGASAVRLTGLAERSTGVTASRLIEPVCEPSIDAAGTGLLPG